MKQVFIGKNGVVVEEVPAPQVEPGTVQIALRHSCISVGTEMSGVTAASQPLWKRALRDPAKVKKAIAMVRSAGFARTQAMVRSKLSGPNPIGYSAAGEVTAVGAGVDDVRVGDLVACAGSQCAYHAEVVCVPRNLVAPIPEGLETREACTVTLGAIALQGIRRAAPTLGESFVVVGLGILGQLTQQLLRINGCRVVGIDLDPRRIERAIASGMHVGLGASDGDAVTQIMRLTGGIGADGVIITAATKSDDVLSQAFNMCRKKARVVVVGDIGLDIDRADIYQKELDFLISTSYGPGRYDQHYEDEGLDYPIGYVRWTEQRNMNEYLRVVASGKLDVASLIDAEYALNDAPAAYAALAKGGVEVPLAVVLKYCSNVEEHARVPWPAPKRAKPGAVRLALIGAGGFAQSTLLPIVTASPDAYSLQAVVARQGHTAMAAVRQYSARYGSTDYREVLDDENIDAVMIATRHNLHARLALDALKAGKHVFVEKPLCLTRDELASIIAFYDEHKDNAAILLVGFNRRFSPYADLMAKLVAKRSNPMIINCRVNAGYIPRDHWVHGPEGGGRNIGEACHFYDLFTFLTGARVADITVKSIQPATEFYARNDNFVATVSFDDGSIATLTYTALGTPTHSKERIDIYLDGKVIQVDDFERLSVDGARHSGLKTRTVQKGHDQELAAFAAAIKTSGVWPIPLWQQVQATEIAFAVESQL